MIRLRGLVFLRQILPLAMLLPVAVSCSNDGANFHQNGRSYQDGNAAAGEGAGRGMGGNPNGTADALGTPGSQNGISNPEHEDDRDSTTMEGREGDAGVQSAENSNGAANQVNPGGAGGAAGPAGTGGTPGTENTGGSTTGGSTTGGSTTGGSTTGGSTTGGGGTTGAGTGTGTGTGTTGSGSEPPPPQPVLATKELVQPGPGSVDVLWIVDSSGSMSEEQTYLGQNFSAFINQLAATGADFQTAVTSTDICDDTIPAELSQRACPVAFGGSSATRLRGSFVGDAGRRVLKRGDADLFARFPAYANVGINGSGFEHGLKAAEMAIAKSLNGTNEALVRSNAFLAVIVVSDEEDDGIGLGINEPGKTTNYVSQGLTTFRYTDDDFIGYLRQAKGEGKFSVSTITGTRNPDGSMCTSSHSRPWEEGTQYIKAAQKTGGIVQSICEPDWNDALAQIGLDLNAQQSQITLEPNPDIATIKVWVDQVLTTEWTYNQGNNAVKFNTNAVPAPGARIKIEYYRVP